MVGYSALCLPVNTPYMLVDFYPSSIALADPSKQVTRSPLSLCTRAVNGGVLFQASAAAEARQHGAPIGGCNGSSHGRDSPVAVARMEIISQPWLLPQAWVDSCAAPETASKTSRCSGLLDQLTFPQRVH